MLCTSKILERSDQLDSVMRHGSLDQAVVDWSIAVLLHKDCDMRNRLLLGNRLVLSDLFAASLGLCQKSTQHLQRSLINEIATTVPSRSYDEGVLDRLDCLSGMPLGAVTLHANRVVAPGLISCQSSRVCHLVLSRGARIVVVSEIRMIQ